MLEDAIGYPWDDGDGLRGLFIGTVLSLLSFLVIPVVFLGGYFVQVLDETLKGEDGVLEWSNYDVLLIDGLRALVVTFGYGGVISGLFVGAVLLVIGGIPGNIGDALLVGVILFIGTVVFFLFLLLAVIVPAALLIMVDRDSVLAAFNVVAVLRLVVSPRYLVGWLVAMLILFIASILAPITSPTVVGPPAVSYYALVSSARAYALGARDVL